MVAREAEPEAVAVEAGNDVEMDVEDVLARSLAVCEQEVDALTSQAGRSKTACRGLGDSKHPRPVLRVQLGERRRVRSRDDEDVPRLDRREVHERERPLVLVHDAHLAVAGREQAEDALAPGTSHRRMVFAPRAQPSRA